MTEAPGIVLRSRVPDETPQLTDSTPPPIPQGGIEDIARQLAHDRFVAKIRGRHIEEQVEAMSKRLSGFAKTIIAIGLAGGTSLLGLLAWVYVGLPGRVAEVTQDFAESRAASRATFEEYRAGIEERLRDIQAREAASDDRLRTVELTLADLRVRCAVRGRSDD